MYARYTIIGLLIGAYAGQLGNHILTGTITGVVIGVLLARLMLLEKQVGTLAASLRRLQRGKQSESRTEEDPAPEASSEPYQAESEPEPATATVETQADEAAWGVPREHKAPSQPSPIAVFFEVAKDWISTGNVPVKVGVIVSFIGVSFLLKYAVDRKILVLSLEMRLVAVALAGAALIALGWYLRKRVRVYALSLQGGGAGILFLTIFAALRIWQLLPASLAFVLLVALALFTAVLAIVQNARILAVLGIVGGFLAPVLASTGQGSHVILFSYYLVLNGAILGIAWFRSWRELNLLGFVFTFVISIYWGYQYFKPALFSSTEPFLLLYFLFYQLIAVFYALRQAPERIGIVDGTLVFGTPVITFALQAELMRNSEYGLAISAVCAAIFYTLLAAWLIRKQGGYLKLLTESFMALAVAFATIAIPLALDARWTSAAWALEGAALVWVGVRQRRDLASLAGAALIFLSGFAFVDSGWRNDIGFAVLNGNVLGGLMISLSAFFASRQLESRDNKHFEALCRLTVTVLFIWGAFWWIGTAWMESVDRIGPYNRIPVFLLFMAASAVLALWLGRHPGWKLMQTSSLVFLPLVALLAFFDWIWSNHLLAGAGWLAWPAALCAQALVLHEMDHRKDTIASTWHQLTLFFFTALLALEVAWWTEQLASNDWARAAAATTIGVVAMLIWRLRNKPSWPVPVHPSAYLTASMFLVASQVAGLALLGVIEPGNPAPFSYFPVLNPFDLAMLVAMVTAWLSLSAIRGEAVVFANPYRILLATGFFIMTTAALVRGVHHLTNIPWQAGTLFDSVIVQTVLSIYWGLLGFGGMILGARRFSRLVWLIGAGFMALVVVKLFLVDLGNSGTLARIISFIGIGTLLLVVGYFAPAPPKQAAPKE